MAPSEVFVGARTVRRIADVEAVAEADGDPNVASRADLAIVRAAKAQEFVRLPRPSPRGAERRRGARAA
jgi:2-keto-3-deoxy-6-phosphogluconate aldolase